MSDKPDPKVERLQRIEAAATNANLECIVSQLRFDAAGFQVDGLHATATNRRLHADQLDALRAALGSPEGETAR